MKKPSQRNLVAAAVALLSSTGASALELNAGDYKFTVNGNVNVHYIYSSCENNPVAVTGGLACTETGTAGNNSSISNGLLPAALSFGVITQQKGLDIEAHFGFYPGVSSNDGGSPNLQQGAPAGTNVGLATTALDVRQIYLTFGNKDIGTFQLGRNFGLFGFDAIINDITIPGVGVAGSAATGAPANTTLGSIGLGYIYVDTLAQINYTTPDFAGAKLTLGIFDPLNPIGAATAQHSAPGFHGKLAYTNKFSEQGKLYLSATFITQKQNDVGLSTDPTRFGNNYRGSGFDAGGKLNFGSFELLGYYYYGKGLGTTALFLLSDDGAGHARKSDGFLAQATYKIGDLKLGVNYGESNLKYAGGFDRANDPTGALVRKNSKISGGAYYSLTKNLTLVGEISPAEAKNHDGGKNEAINFNIGTFLSF